MRQHTLPLTPEQRTELEQARNRDPRPYFRERAAALLKIAAGQSGREVALHGLPQRRQPKTVYAWLHAYQRQGLNGLVQRPRGHRGFSPSARGAVGRGDPAGAQRLSPRPQSLALGGLR
jgi:hypothetical protein